MVVSPPPTPAALDDDQSDDSENALFAAADADGSGALDAAELSRLHPAIEGLDVGERLRAEVDVDGSGAVELVEFAASGHHWKHARLEF